MQNEVHDGHILEVYTGNLTTREIIDGFINRVGKDELMCVEKIGQTRLRIYFGDTFNVTAFLEQPFLIGDLELCFFGIGERVKTVLVKGLPFNLPEKSVYNVIKKYGRVHSIGYERHAGYRPLCTGTRVVKMRLESPIPNFLRVDQFTAVISYKNQVTVCKRCGGKGHLAKVCNTQPSEFQPGFPVHTRPVFPKFGKRVMSTTVRADAEVQTVYGTLNNDDTASGQNSDSSTETTTLKNISLNQRLNGLLLEDLDVSSEASASSLSQVETFETSLPDEKLQTKVQTNVKKGMLCSEENTMNQNMATDPSAEVSISATSVTIGEVGTVANVTEINECVTAVKKKKKKKKKSSK